jgi:hypothetical protein
MVERHFDMGVVYWKKNDALITAMDGTFRQLGVQTIPLEPGQAFPRHLDAILACGPFGSLVPVANQILARSPDRRPLFAVWVTEQFANPALPQWIHRLGAETRSLFERWAFRRHKPGLWQLNGRWRYMAQRALRLRYYGDLLWLQRKGILSVLAVGSDWIAGFLRQRHLHPIVAYIGLHPDWGHNLELQRDNPVLWLGKLATGRRETLLRDVEGQLASRGIDMLVVDGVQHPYVFGQERTHLLNRTKIVLNLLRTPWDNHSLRFFLAAANKALIVSEPTYPHVPFEPGVHLVTAPPHRLAATIARYLQDDAARATITDRAYELVTRELTMKQSAQRILDRLLVLRQEQSS